MFVLWSVLVTRGPPPQKKRQTRPANFTCPGVTSKQTFVALKRINICAVSRAKLMLAIAVPTIQVINGSMLPGVAKTLTCQWCQHTEYFTSIHSSNDTSCWRHIRMMQNHISMLLLCRLSRLSGFQMSVFAINLTDNQVMHNNREQQKRNIFKLCTVRTKKFSSRQICKQVSSVENCNSHRFFLKANQHKASKRNAILKQQNCNITKLVCTTVSWGFQWNPLHWWKVMVWKTGVWPRHWSTKSGCLQI